uniref:Uncharacterized protein n=1 Tax=Oryza rufipogon TaxID=4529 RepID=A0A0E0MTM7_ORYRU
MSLSSDLTFLPLPAVMAVSAAGIGPTGGALSRCRAAAAGVGPGGVQSCRRGGASGPSPLSSTNPAAATMNRTADGMEIPKFHQAVVTDQRCSTLDLLHVILRPSPIQPSSRIRNEYCSRRVTFPNHLSSQNLRIIRIICHMAY